jgi:hypothetical protein
MKCGRRRANKPAAAEAKAGDCQLSEVMDSKLTPRSRHTISSPSWNSPVLSLLRSGSRSPHLPVRVRSRRFYFVDVRQPRPPETHGIAIVGRGGQADQRIDEAVHQTRGTSSGSTAGDEGALRDIRGNLGVFFHRRVTLAADEGWTMLGQSNGMSMNHMRQKQPLDPGDLLF